MKKLFLLLAAGSIAMNVGAQALQPASKDGGTLGLDKVESAGLRNYVNQRYIYANHRAEKATSGGSRWYNYGSAIDTSQQYQNVVVQGNPYQTMFVSEETIWNDTNGTANYTSGLAHVTDVSEGSVFDPKASIFNTDQDMAYVGQIRVTGADAYTWDSVSISGKYFYNKTKTSIVDTLRLAFVTGSGGPVTSDDIYSGWGMASGHYNADAFLSLIWDSLTNTATNHTYNLPVTQKRDILLYSGSHFDTSSNGFWDTSLAVNPGTGLSVAAGALCGMSVTFISGDPATKTGILATPTPGDTLIDWNPLGGGNRYNVLRPLLDFYQTTGGTAAWAPYQCPAFEAISKDQNLGYWKRLPNTPANWDDLFLPTWAWTQGTGAADLQYADIGYHITCVSCAVNVMGSLGVNKFATVNGVNAYPNPATGELNISFDLSQASDVTVTLTNMVGQVVATQNVNNITTGKVVFNTSALPAGIYIYSLTSNGGVTTGRVSVAH